MEKLIKRFYYFFIGFIISLLIICIISLSTIQNDEIKMPEISIILVSLLLIVMIPISKVFKWKFDVAVEKIRVFGNGYFINIISVTYLMLGVLSLFILALSNINQAFSNLEHLFFGLFWIMIGIVNVRRGYISIQNKVITVKGKDFYLKNVSLIKFTDGTLSITNNKMINDFTVSSFSQDEIASIIDALEKSEFKEKLYLA